MGDLKQGGKKSPGHNKSEYLTRKKKSQTLMELLRDLHIHLEIKEY